MAPTVMLRGETLGRDKRPAVSRMIEYPLARFDFVRLVSDALGEPDLTLLGHHVAIERRTRQTDQDTPWHGIFYRSFPRWKLVYEAFIREIVAAQFTKPFFYQAVPTLRVHLPGNVAVGEFHTDTEYGHSAAEINLWLPLTPAFDTNSLWIESEPGLGDYHPIVARPGLLMLFDACRLRHGNLENRSGYTRVSFDFRCLSQHEYRNTSQRSVNSRLRMAPGEYFSPVAVEPIR